MIRPVIMVVDDEPQVLNAVERDLRRHFRSNYTIVKADSGAQALETTRRLKERGTPVALFVSDERMPEMSGTQFLAETRSLYSDSCRVLLTAYADTEAAISGINQVGLNHYLMKPWDPPEERLYPVLDELLEDWTASYRPLFDGIRVAGTMWSPHSHDVKDFLSRHQIPYEWVDLDQNDEMRALIEGMTPGLQDLPAVLFPEGQSLLRPTLQALAERIGHQTRPTGSFYDVVVIGGGPAGLAGAVYAASEGLRTILVESDVPGGQAGTSSQIENYLGFPSGVTGADLARRAAAQAKRFGTELVAPHQAKTIRVQHPYRLVSLDDGNELSCYAVLVASGMKVNRLEVPGVAELTGAGVYYGAALSEAAAYRGKNIFVIGGANSAGQAAMLFSRYAEHVTMVLRGPTLTTSMSRYLVTRIEEAPNVSVLSNTRVERANGTQHLGSISLVDSSGQSREVQADAMFIFIGSAPRSDAVTGLVELDERGFILTGPDLLRGGRRPKGWILDRDPFLLETSIPGVFAAGDVRSGSTKRVASAVGEGSSAIGMIHKYLEAV